MAIIIGLKASFNFVEKSGVLAGFFEWHEKGSGQEKSLLLFSKSTAKRYLSIMAQKKVIDMIEKKALEEVIEHSDLPEQIQPADLLTAKIELAINLTGETNAPPENHLEEIEEEKTYQ
jgi:hypothetical protein